VKETSEGESVSDAGEQTKEDSAATGGGESIEKPGHTVASEVVKAGSDEPESTPNYTHFQNKRLCERWLDNLFMVLYEDLRVYTIWRTEMAQYRQQQLAYKKSAEEWEILGELAERLHHLDEAVEAYENCLQMRFSPKAMRGILKLNESRHNIRDVCGALIKLVTWQYRWYSEVSFSRRYKIPKLTPCYSFHRPFSILSGSLLKRRVQSRFEASYKEQAFLSMF
jgi:hypothetical protein